jgi:membrane-bound serine protease (ClpP class)
MGFDAFPGYGLMIAFGIVGMMAVAVGLWIRYFPRSPIGKKMTVSQDLAECKASDPNRKALVGKRGVTVSELRPAGFAMIEGRRMDVIAQGKRIDSGTAVEVVRVEGIRVLVKPAPRETAETT